jgi:hypothetical protein
MMKGPREIVRHSKPDHPTIVWHWNARKFHSLTLWRGEGRQIEKLYYHREHHRPRREYFVIGLGQRYVLTAYKREQSALRVVLQPAHPARVAALTDDPQSPAFNAAGAVRDSTHPAKSGGLVKMAGRRE